MPILPAKSPQVVATLFCEGRVVLNDEQTHLVLFLRSGEVEHRFALDLASARTLTAEMVRVLGEVE